MNKVSIEVAQQEIDGWLDFKKVSQKKREEKQDGIADLVDAICEGYLIVGESNQLTYTLKFPIGDESKITKLEFKPRISAELVQSHLQGIKSNDLTGMIVGYVAALTGEVKNIIKKMDSEDFKVAQSIALFFI